MSRRARWPQDRIDIRSCRRCDAAELAAVRLGFLPLSRTGAGFPTPPSNLWATHPTWNQECERTDIFACVMQEIGAGGCESRHTQIAPMSGTAFLEI